MMCAIVLCIHYELTVPVYPDGSEECMQFMIVSNDPTTITVKSLSAIRDWLSWNFCGDAQRPSSRRRYEYWEENLIKLDNPDQRLLLPGVPNPEKLEYLNDYLNKDIELAEYCFNNFNSNDKSHVKIERLRDNGYDYNQYPLINNTVYKLDI